MWWSIKVFITYSSSCHDQLSFHWQMAKCCGSFLYFLFCFCSFCCCWFVGFFLPPLFFFKLKSHSSYSKWTNVQHLHEWTYHMIYVGLICVYQGSIEYPCQARNDGQHRLYHHLCQLQNKEISPAYLQFRGEICLYVCFCVFVWFLVFGFIFCLRSRGRLSALSLKTLIYFI